MNIQFCQPEENQTDLSRKALGARLACERIESQIEATIKRAIALAALLASAACGSPATEAPTATSISEQSDAGSQCVITLCGVAHSGLCQSEYGDVINNAGGANAVAGEPSWCSTADLGNRWQTCCAVWCSPGDDATFEYNCGTVAK